VRTGGLDCARAEELLSDHLEGTLDPILAREMDEHLRACAGCAELRATLSEVVSALRTYPSLEPAAGLAARVARAAILHAQQQRHAVFAPRMPAWVQAVAAGLSIATTLGILLAQGGTVRAGGRLMERTTSAGSYVLEKKDRLLEDVRILRVVVGAAIEGRLDRVSDRVEDYRRLIERRREAEQQRRPAPPSPSPDQAPATHGDLPNSAASPRVEPAVERSNR
jgi:predicted anti-sigma-YlaC factor YlaD